MSEGRLRFIRRYGEADDLYAVVKTEPEAKSEGLSPLIVSVREWATLIDNDPLNVFGRYQTWSEKLIRLHVASFGTLPRYSEFMRDVRDLGRGVITGNQDSEPLLTENFRHLGEQWINRPAFVGAYREVSDEDFVARVYANAGVQIDESTRAGLANELKEKRATRTDVLLKLIDDAGFAEREKNRSLVLLHFFGYLRRNPDDPPDNNMNGLLHWVNELNRGYDPASLTYAFVSSIEHQRILKKTPTRSDTPAQPKASLSPWRQEFRIQLAGVFHA